LKREQNLLSFQKKQENTDFFNPKKQVGWDFF